MLAMRRVFVEPISGDRMPWYAMMGGAAAMELEFPANETGAGPLRPGRTTELEADAQRPAGGPAPSPLRIREDKDSCRRIRD